MGEATSGGSHRRGKPPRPSQPKQRPPAPPRPAAGKRARVLTEERPRPEPVREAYLPPRKVPRSNGWRTRADTVGFWLGIGLGAVIVGGYLAIALLSGSSLPKGASVAGVAIGEMTPKAAEAKLRTELAARASATITLEGGPVTSTVDPRTAGLALDVPESVRRAAGGGRFAPTRVWREFRGGGDVDAVATTDPKKLGVQVARMAGEIRKPVTEGAIGFDRGKAVSVAPQNGRGVSTKAVRRAVLHGFLRPGKVEVDVDVLKPKVDAQAVADAMKKYADPVTSGPVELVIGDDDVVAPTALFTQAITLRAKGGDLEPRLDVDDLFAALEPLMGSVAGAARPAAIEIEDGKPTVVPSKKGVTFDRDDLSAKFLDAALSAKGDRRVNVKGVTSQPTFTTDDAKAMGVTEQLDQTGSEFGYADYRNTNLARGAELLDGTIVQPGDTFSFENTIGRPTEKNGFTPGYELVGGVFQPDPGAGLSQLASAVYQAAFDAGLKDAGHATLAVHSDRYPLGREVSVEYGAQDLKFTNDTKYGVLIKASVVPSSTSGPGSVAVSFWSTRTWDVKVKVGQPYAQVQPKVMRKKVTGCQTVVGTAGFSVDLTRVFRAPGSSEVDHRDKATTTYPVADSVSCDK